MQDLMEKVKGKVVEAISAISSKSLNSIALMELRTKLRNLEKEKEDTINELGRLVYDLLRRNDYNDQRIKDFYSSISLIERQIETIENEIKRRQEVSATKGMTSTAVCECGAGLTSGQKFCSTCGKDVQTILDQGGQTTEGFREHL